MLHLLSQINPQDRASLGEALTAHLHAVAAPAPEGGRARHPAGYRSSNRRGAC